MMMMESVPFVYMYIVGYGCEQLGFGSTFVLYFVVVCSLSFELLPPRGSGGNQSATCTLYVYSTATGQCSTLPHRDNKVLRLLKECTQSYYALSLTMIVTESIFNAKLRPECGAASTWLSQQHYFLPLGNTKYFIQVT